MNKNAKSEFELLKETDLGRSLAAKFTVKKVKVNVGHERAGYSCDLYLRGKKVLEVDDDGWGGEVALRDPSSHRHSDLLFLDEEIVSEVKEFSKLSMAQYKLRWGLDSLADRDPEQPDSDDTRTLDMTLLVEALVNETVSEKAVSKLAKKAIVYGNVRQSEEYYTVKFGNPAIPMATVVQMREGPRVILEALETLRKEVMATPNTRILNRGLPEAIQEVIDDINQKRMAEDAKIDMRRASGGVKV